jgi:hypothetical protein
MSINQTVASRSIFRKCVFVILALGLCLVMKSMPPSYAACADATTVQVNGQKVKAGQAIKVSGREVVIKVYFESEATDYRICEDPSFADCSWQRVPGGERPMLVIKYTLSEGSGIKTIYFQAQRNSTIASVVNLQIEQS